MANYKPYGHRALTIEGLFRPWPSGESITFLATIANPTTIGYSFHNTAGVNYTVPAGKKLKLIAGWVQDGTTARLLSIQQSDTADSSTAAVKKVEIITNAASQSYWLTMYEEPEILATKYVNQVTNNITGTPRFSYLIGVELEA